MHLETVCTLDLYEGIKSLLDQENKSDTAYAVAKFLGASRQSGYRWRDNEHTMDDKYAIRASLALKMDPDYVLACLAAERASRGHQDETAAAWQRIAARLATAASICFLLALPILQMQNPA